jgi:hypothetical protein
MPLCRSHQQLQNNLVYSAYKQPYQGNTLLKTRLNPTALRLGDAL